MTITFTLVLKSKIFIEKLKTQKRLYEFFMTN